MRRENLSGATADAALPMGQKPRYAMSVDAMPKNRSKFVLPIVMACAAALFATIGQAAVSEDFAGLVDIGAGRKM